LHDRLIVRTERDRAIGRRTQREPCLDGERIRLGPFEAA
jgi:hypothetical protein